MKKYYFIFPILISMFFLYSSVSFALPSGIPAKNSDKEVVPQNATDKRHKFSSW
jgi:hypothetical protein